MLGGRKDCAFRFVGKLKKSPMVLVRGGAEMLLCLLLVQTSSCFFYLSSVGNDLPQFWCVKKTEENAWQPRCIGCVSIGMHSTWQLGGSALMTFLNNPV